MTHDEKNNTKMKHQSHYKVIPILHLVYTLIAIGIGFITYYIANDAKLGIQVGVILLALVAAGFIKDALTAYQSKRESIEKQL